MDSDIHGYGKTVLMWFFAPEKVKKINIVKLTIEIVTIKKYETVKEKGSVVSRSDDVARRYGVESSVCAG